MALDNALPWFPITPDYIDRYHDDVMKYLRDSWPHTDAELKDDASFATTLRLLFQRAAQVRDAFLSASLLESRSLPKETLERDIKVTAAAALWSTRTGGESTAEYLSLLCCLVSLHTPEMSDQLSALCIRCIKAGAVESVGFTMDDITDMDIPDLVRRMENSTMLESKDTRWFQNHGTVKVDADGIALYSMSRFFVSMKEKGGGTTLRPVLVTDSGQLSVRQERKSGRQSVFDPARFADDCADVQEDEERVVLKTYEDGDQLTVRVRSVGYDSITAESTDSSYEPLVKDIRITGASNVRGIYMTDFTRNMHSGTMVNVIWCEALDCFSIDETVIDFIYDRYWSEQEDGSTYDSTDAILLFQHAGEVPNTWLTREGFLVRTQDDGNWPRFTRKCLDIVDYDKKYDFIIAEVSDADPDDDPLDERTVRDSFINYLLYKNRMIVTPAVKKPEVKYVSGDLLTELHRIEAVKAGCVHMSSSARAECIGMCSALACILGDGEDSAYYGILSDYLKARVKFAAGSFRSLAPLDKRGLHDPDILMMSAMVSVLNEYGAAEDSDVIDAAIEKLPDTPVAAVARLVQAANRFMGTSSLERLRVDLHREICASIGVADSIVVVEGEDTFPFRPEGPDVEHKMSWVFDNETSLFNETSQGNKCLKTICAFMNRYQEQGDAHLYIGTDDTRKQICGFRNDIDALLEKGRLTAKGDITDEYLRKIIQDRIQERFPDTYQNVDPSVICDGRVVDLCVHPAKEGVVYFNGVAYYRFGAKSKEMTPAIEEEIKSRKYLMRSGMADKIDAVRRAINSRHTVSLMGYDSSNSNTQGKDRKVEVFAFTDATRCDAVWALDPKDRKCKVFLLRRADSVKVLDEEWKNERLHAVSPLDIFGFSGDAEIPVDFILKTTRARNQFLDLYPSSAGSMEKLGDGWRVTATLYNELSLEAACGFFLSISSEVDIRQSPKLVERVNKRIDAILSEL